jgi:glycosyltransferase involved in cell wall biosynthesis
MSALPKITVVTPSLNQAHFIERMLASIRSQDYPNLEHLVVDGGSTDGTLEILRRAEGPAGFRWTSGPDTGQSDAINKGIRQATGEIVGWLNADDEFFPGALRAIGAAFAEHPTATVIYGAGAKIEEDGQLQKEVPARPFDRVRLASAFYFLQPSMFFTKSAFLQVNGLDESLHYAMDWDFLLKLPSTAEFYSIPDKIGKLRCYAATKSSTGGWPRMREIALIGRRHHGIFDRNAAVFFFRDRIGRIGNRQIRTVLQKVVDRTLPWIFGKDCMVEGWPDRAN